MADQGAGEAVGGSDGEVGRSAALVTEPEAAFHLARTTFPALFAVVDRLESTIGLPLHFSEKLAAEDDWSFIIKLHALLESVLTVLLVERLGDEVTAARLRDVVSQLPMSDQHTGKVQLALALGLLTDRDQQFIRILSEIRNAMVHQVKMVGVTLPQYMASLEKGKRRQILQILVPEVPQLSATVHSLSVHETLKNPKPNIWLGGVILLFQSQLQIDVLVIKRGRLTDDQVREAAQRTHEMAQDLIKLAKMALEVLKELSTV